MHTSTRWAAVVASAFTAVALSVAPAGAAGSPSSPAGGCSDGKPWYKVVQVGAAAYEPIGHPLGKYNASSQTTPLEYERGTTYSKATTWEVSAGGSIGWAIATVEAKTSYSVTKSVAKNETVRNTMLIPPKKFGYMAPKIERRTFKVQEWKTVSPCQDVFIRNMGRLKAITAHPFFSECVASSQCTPKP